MGAVVAIVERPGRYNRTLEPGLRIVVPFIDRQQRSCAPRARRRQTLPQIAKGDANKVWIVPSEISKALEGIGDFLGSPDRSRDATQRRAEANGAVPGPCRSQ